jgi:hypothetical protein
VVVSSVSVEGKGPAGFSVAFLRFIENQLNFMQRRVTRSWEPLIVVVSYQSA